MMYDFNGFNIPIVSNTKTIPHKIACTYKAGENSASTHNASGTIAKPRIKIRKTAGPSALSFCDRSNPQWSHLSFKARLKRDGYKFPPWHLGHLHFIPCHNVFRNSSNLD